jgi:uncharacterized protein YabE (DUF348 family)
MKAIHRNKITPFGATVSTLSLLAAFAGTLLVSQASAASPQAAPDSGRILTIHDRGSEKVILTKAETLKDALTSAGVMLDKNDTVEPNLSEKLVATDYQVNIYRARPVIVVDGATRQKIMTPYQTPAQIANDAGISLHDEDVTTISRTADIVAEGAGITMTVTRATPFNLTMYGKKIEARTQAKTVDDMLAQKNISLAANDTLSVDRQAPIVAGMTIELWRNGIQTVTEDQAIPFEVQKIQDADHEVGYREVQTPGENGTKSVTYEINMRNGQQVSRKEIQSVITKESKKQVEVVGAKLPTPTNPTEAQALGYQMMLAAGFGEDQWPCLYNLWMHESGWRTTASNPSGAYGIPQALPGSKMGTGWQTDAATQIQWGLGYIRGRYATPCGAYSAWQSKGWY